MDNLWTYYTSPPQDAGNVSPSLLAGTILYTVSSRYANPSTDVQPLDIGLEYTDENAHVINGANKPVRVKTAWDVLEEWIGKVEGPVDGALEHDHYLYETPKRGHVDEA